MIFLNYYYYYYLRFALFCVHRKMIRVGQYRQLGVLTYHVTSAGRGLRQHFITPCWGLRHHSSGLHWPCYVTSSERRALCSATSGPAWGMEPCPASSSDRVVNTEHINQLSCLHAPSFKFLTCVRFDQALYLFEKKLLVKNFLVQTLFAHTWRATRAHYTWGLL